MKINIYILVVLISFVGCVEKDNGDNKTTKIEAEVQQKPERISFENISEIAEDESYSTWVWIKTKDSSASLALHFDHNEYKDTLAVSYSPECWLFFPYKLDNERIVVYWDKNIDTKYDFELVKAINKTSDKYLGKPFMILELANDTTFKATYPIKELIQELNRSSKVRTFFAPQYLIAQNGFL